MTKINFLKTFALLTGLGLFSACSSDDAPAATNEAQDGDVYMSFQIVNTGAAGSRSETNTPNDSIYGTSTGGTEVGSDVENAITSVNVFFVYNGSTYAATNVISPDKDATDPKYTAVFQNSQIESLYGQDVDLMVYCNMGTEVYEANKVQTGTSYGTQTAGQFQMSNADTGYKTTLNGTPFPQCNSVANAYDLGTVNVERAAARFDFNTANVTFASLESSTDKNKVTVTFQKMGLVNESTSWYATRRTSAIAYNTSLETTLCGVETSSNFVVDTDWADKSGWADAMLNGNSANPPQLPTGFNDPVSGVKDWSADKWTTISNITTDDNYTSTEDYKVLRYCNENTIGNKDHQLNGISTGVVFKAELTGDKVPTTGTDKIYVFRNVLYGTWTQVEAAKATDAALAVAYDNAMAGSGYNDAQAVAAGFSIFAPEIVEDTPHYYALYYYWNRHNDNNNPTVMGNMEFAVVRNNVYKLSIDTVLEFGHPTDPTLDPDPVDPNDPDEKDKVYFKIAVKVMPWVVRINNITF